jgi:hypothetical protein
MVTNDVLCSQRLYSFHIVQGTGFDWRLSDICSANSRNFTFIETRCGDCTDNSDIAAVRAHKMSECKAVFWIVDSKTLPDNLKKRERAFEMRQ